jgi:hypothetical protein
MSEINSPTGQNRNLTWDSVKTYVTVIGTTLLFWCVAIFIITHTTLTRSPTQQEIDAVTQAALRAITALHDQVSQDQAIISKLQDRLSNCDRYTQPLKEKTK